jgi:anti-sigma regulatory factor (Ser/Thr protein kinase)
VTRPAGLLERDARWAFAVQDSSAAAEARRGIVGVLQQYGATEAEANISELVFSELLGNVIRYGSDDVEFALDISGDAPVLHALDRGPGFTYSARLPMDVLSEGGRGLFIVRSLTHDLNVTRRNDGGSHARAVLAFAIRAPHAESRVPASSLPVISAGSAPIFVSSSRSAAVPARVPRVVYDGASRGRDLSG